MSELAHEHYFLCPMCAHDWHALCQRSCPVCEGECLCHACWVKRNA